MKWSTDSPLEVSTIMERVASILDEDDMCILGTIEDQEPRLTPCFFARLGEYRLVFVSSKEARHVINGHTNPHCSALVVPKQTQGRLVSVHLSGTIMFPQGRDRLAALTAYASQMKSKLLAVKNMHGLLDKRVFILEAERVEFVDTHLHHGRILIERTHSVIGNSMT